MLALALVLSQGGGGGFVSQPPASAAPNLGVAVGLDDLRAGVLGKTVTWKGDVDIAGAMTWLGNQGVSVVYRENAFDHMLSNQVTGPEQTKFALPKVRISIVKRPLREAMMAVAVAYDAHWRKLGGTYVLLPGPLASMGRGMGGGGGYGGGGGGF